MTRPGTRPAGGAGRAAPPLTRSSLVLLVGLLCFAAASAAVLLTR